MPDESQQLLPLESQTVAASPPDGVSYSDESVAHQQELATAAELQRLDHIAGVLDMVLLQTQDSTGGASDSSVVALDDSQWSALTARVDSMRDIQSLTLYLVLLMLCGVGALLGGHLFKVFSEGFRR